MLIPENDFANEVVVPESRIQTNFQNQRSESLPRYTVSIMEGFQVQKWPTMTPASLAALLFLRTLDWSTEPSSVRLIPSSWTLNLSCSKVLFPKVWLTDSSIGSLRNLLAMHCRYYSESDFNKILRWFRWSVSLRSTGPRAKVSTLLWWSTSQRLSI